MHEITERIKDRFPNPVSIDEAHLSEQSYCVGGAIGLYTEQCCERFPDPAYLINALRSLNSALPVDKAQNYVHAITATNDNGDIDGAWALLDAAMNYGANV